MESKFLENSHPIFKQILQSQREFKSVSGFGHNESWVDFSHTIPYLFKGTIKSPYSDAVLDNIYKTKVLEVEDNYLFFTLIFFLKNNSKPIFANSNNKKCFQK